MLAQQWVRDTTNDEKQRHWDALADQGPLPAATHAAIRLEIGLRQAEGRNFAAPDDWAPFVFTGVW